MGLSARLRSLPLRRVALAGVVAQVGIVVTGAAVRLTGSGLGCPTWPRCSNDAFIPNGVRNDHPALQQGIEFGNRLLTFAVLATAALCVLAARRTGRRDLLWLAWAQPLGVVGQILLGGITVLTDLHPAAVAAHFLLSMAVIAAAVLLYERSLDSPAGDSSARELTWIARALLPATGLLLLIGTVVTGAGPHAGDSKSPRFGINIEHITQLHADVAFLVLALALALAVGARLGSASTALCRRSAELLVVVLAQGAIGYVQYFTGVPALLVGFHVLGACLAWVAALRVYLASRSAAAASLSSAPSDSRKKR
ncbi:MAG: heme a synthase [Frankiales bacterium]|nr:heme a synthase [Frankiales bacterium]